MILIDTNVLVALIDPADALRQHAAKDLRRLHAQPMSVTESVLAESLFLLPAAHLRQKLRHLLASLGVGASPTTASLSLRDEVFDWLERYAEHQPDWTDGELAVLCGRDRRLRVWSYDTEFSTIWRRPDGTRIPLAIRSRA